LIGKSLGNYKVVETLGQGGMSAVYVGYQETVDRKVAIKVLSTALGHNPQFVERFQLEARTVARLQHPHILPLYDYGKQDDVLYLVMAYVEGGTLEDIIDGGPMSLGRVERILREVAGALDYAHRQGVIHRDIKPANILLDTEGHALLADFGIVKLAEGQTNLTGTGVVGTPAYMAPEQAQGLPLDTRADIYSLGVVVYEMITATQPFEGETLMQVMVRVMQQPPPDIAEITEGLPPALSPVMKKVLSKDPGERYQTASAFADAFSMAIGTGEREAVATRVNLPEEDTQRFGPISTTPITNPTGRVSDSQTVIVQQGISPLVLLGGIAIIAAAVIIAMLLVLNNNPTSQPTPEPQNTSVAVVDTEEAATEAPTTGVTPVAPSLPVFGQAGFSSSGGSVGNTLNLSVSDLPPASEGSYTVWLANTQDDFFLNVGQLALDPFGSGAMSFSDPEGRMLPAFFNQVLITTEADPGDAPSGEAAFVGQVPVEIMLALREIFVASEDGLSGGSLLEGALAEARTGAQHAGLAAGASSLGSMHTHAEHSINILRGESEDYNGNGRGENPGRGVGLFTFLDLMNDAIQTGIDAAADPVSLAVNAEPMLICMDNTRLRAEEIEALAREMLAAESLETLQPQIADMQAHSDTLLGGEDLNQSGVIDPFEGECGIQQVSTFGVLASRIELTKNAATAVPDDATEATAEATAEDST
jgi:serine/threonine protein kinase